MSEEQIMLELEMYLVYFCQNNCIEHTCLSAINILFLQFGCMQTLEKKLEKCCFSIFEWSPSAHNVTKMAKVNIFY